MSAKGIKLISILSYASKSNRYFCYKVLKLNHCDKIYDVVGHFNNRNKNAFINQSIHSFFSISYGLIDSAYLF